MRTIGQRRRALGAALQKMRYDAGKRFTMEYVAQEIGVSRNTIAAWESGTSIPDLIQLEDLADLYGVSPIKRLVNYRHPELFLEEADAERERVIEYLKNQAPPYVIKQLDFMISGRHGSDPTAFVQEMNAVLQLPLSLRYHIASMVRSMFEMAIRCHSENCPDDVMPDMEIWNAAINAGLSAAAAGRNEYDIPKEAKE